MLKTICILIALSLPLQATPLSQDDPQFVRLSDGRIVPFGQGSICSDSCNKPELDPKPKWPWVVAALVTGGIFTFTLLRDPKRDPIYPSDPVVPISPGVPTSIPEPATLFLLGAGLLTMAGMLKKRSQ